MNRTTITFWRGLRTIGGNIAEIRYGNDRIIFDFGLIYDPVQAIPQHDDRTDSFVLDKLKIGAIPHIDGIYAEQDLQGSSYNMTKPLSFEASPYNTSVFISHLHLDHIGAVDTLSRELPIYMSQPSKQLFETLNDIGEALQRTPPVRDYTFNEPIHVGEITVTPYRVDHDIIGASAFLIETPDATIVNSGDIRMHGQHPEWNDAWINDMTSKDIDLLLMEGTTFFPDEGNQAEKKGISERDIRALTTELLHETKGLVTFNIYHRNIDRLNHFVTAAQQASRTIVFEPETAYVADCFLEQGDFAIYHTSMPHTHWHKALTEKYTQVTNNDINKQPGQYVLQNSYDRMMNLLDFNLQDSLYIHSNGMPLGAFDPAFNTMHAFLEMLDMSYHSLNISGHATNEDILAIIDRINPKLLIPWHSFHPELVKPINDHQAVYLPEQNTTYTINSGKLTAIN
ncbi:MBL fold metallo-hydrolase [Pontibacillus litoralis]|uniref:Metallo-beta-lactamase domain-containing protein n=1 Tax=Pontibacillus litoralis JSM 072002 TaxID=1385512 RepID=A0A0A5HUS5_9BACI|nr:MBL fold metallo-hydrolase [Pontibacillus litoralis]KGX87387.1 hypothetical protein N784_15425 [Pontibacillus litoralis JSM 072002]